MPKSAKPKVSITDVARAAGVSTATVDRVLNLRGGVRPDKEERIIETARALVLDRALSLWVTGIQGMPTEARAIWAPAVTSTLLWPWLFVVLRDVRRRYQVS